MNIILKKILVCYIVQNSLCRLAKIKKPPTQAAKKKTRI